MAAAASLLSSLEMRICGNYGYYGQFKGLMEKTSLNSFSLLTLSSHSVRQDAWSLYILKNVHGPLIPKYAKFNGFVCRSLLKPSGGNEVPVLKAAATVISRSYSTLRESSHLLQLVPAVAIIAFAAWGLGPLVRLGMIPFINMGFEFAAKAVYTAVWVAAVSLFMELLGFSTQKWLTAGGLGTVLLTLAGREILTNFLSSVMIHATQPFVLNDWIQTKIEGYEVSGTVEHVGWWSPTVIRGNDREAVHIPSHKFTVNVVRNLSQKTHWRIKTNLAISHLDVNKINNIVADMRKVLAKNPQIEQQKLHRRVFLDNVDTENQALIIMVSCFVKTSRFEEYLCVKESILLDLLRVISHHRARLATPIRRVQKVYGEADMETIPFSETIFNRARATSNRPFLLIDSSYKVNNDDKIRTPGRTVQPNEEKNEKVEATSTSDAKVFGKAGPTSIADDDKVNEEASLELISDGISKAATGTNSTSDSLPNMGSVGSGQSNSVKQTANRAVSKETSVVATGLNVKDFLSGEKAPEMQRPSVQELGNDDRAVASTTSQAMPDVEKIAPSPSASKTTLDDNIVLGVALEGSRMTLFEEDMMPTPTQSEVKEVSANRNGNGLATVCKDKQDEMAKSQMESMEYSVISGKKKGD